MRLVTLTSKNSGAPNYVNPELVASVTPTDTGAMVLLGNGIGCEVRETPERVIELLTGDLPVPPKADQN